MMVYWDGNLTEHFTKDEYTVGCEKYGKYDACYLTREAYLQAMMMEEFRVWLKRPVIVTCWFRTKEYNKAVGGVATSNHLRGCATDWHTNITITDAKFVKYAKKWKSICKAHGVVGEAGLYKWGCHFGYQNDEQVKINKGKFFNWDSRSGKQKNNAFKI